MSMLRIFHNGEEVERWVGVFHMEYIDSSTIRLTEIEESKTRRKMKPILKLSFVLAVVSWIAVFLIAALMVSKVVADSSTNKFLFLAFLIIAILASATYSGKPKIRTNDIRVRIGNEIFTGDSLTVHEIKDGSVFVYVDLSKPEKKKK